MHQCLVMEQLRAVVIAEGGAAAQADAMRACGRLGQQIRIQRDGDDAPFEEGVQIVCSCMRRAVADTGTCSSGASSSRSSSCAIWMKCRAASRVLGPLPGIGSSGTPNSCAE